MHRGLPEGNTKSVLILFPALGPSDHWAGSSVASAVLPSSGDIRQTPSYGSTPHRVLPVHTCAPSVPK